MEKLFGGSAMGEKSSVHQREPEPTMLRIWAVELIHKYIGNERNNTMDGWTQIKADGKLFQREV